MFALPQVPQVIRVCVRRARVGRRSRRAAVVAQPPCGRARV